MFHLVPNPPTLDQLYAGACIKAEWRKHLNIFNRMVELIFNKATL